MNSIYQINKGINTPIEFRGLKAQYIGYLAAGLVALLVSFAVLYITGVSIFFCVPFVLVAGTLLITTVYRLSHKYGQYGLLKKAAARNVPRCVRCHSLKTFTRLASANRLIQ